MSIRSLVLVLFFFGTSTFVTAQGYMSSPGFTGKHAQFRLLQNRYSQSMEIMPGVTFGGRFSLSFGLGYTQYDLSDQSGFSFSQKISGIILKQGREMPVTLALNIDFQKGFIESEIPTEDNPISQFSLSLHHAFRGVNKMQFIPTVEVGTRQEIKRVDSIYEPYGDFFTALSLTYGYTYFYIEPKIVFHDEQKLFQLSAGVFIP